MVIPTTTVVALRCPSCGKLELYALSLFQFVEKKTMKVECSCGCQVLTVSTKDRKRFMVQVRCAMCEEIHLLHFGRKELWSQGKARELCCEETGFEIGFVGSREMVRRSIQLHDRTLAEMAGDLGFTDYFENPDIMYKVLDSLHQVAEAGGLTCRCGNQNIEVEIFPDKIELFCDECDSRNTVWARNETDLSDIRTRGEIRIGLKETVRTVSRGRKKIPRNRPD